jgi:hypothetical protein
LLGAALLVVPPPLDVLMVLGLIFILRNLGIVSAESFDLIWFGIFVLVGLWLVLQSKMKKSTS